MKTLKHSILAALSLLAVVAVDAQAPTKDWAQFYRYENSNKKVTTAPEAVFMGNSITDNWAKFRPEFFADNGFVGRGISGQTTSQMLVRFRADVIDLHPKKVVILAGTNDIAGNTGPSSLEMIMDNLKSMCDIAKANKIRPILCSVLPAYRYSWKKDVRCDQLIPELNEMIKAYAKANKITYVDFFTALVDHTPGNENGLPKKYSKDGVHPNIEGYYIMEKILLKALKK